MNTFQPAVALSVNPYIIGKPPESQRSWHAEEWRRTMATPERIANMVVTKGCAWTCSITAQKTFPRGLTGGRRRQDTFESLQLFGVDFDGHGINYVLNRFELAAECASFAYESASSVPGAERCRIVFCAEKPHAYQPAKTLIRALYWHFHDAEPDKQTKDPTRLWYGAPGKRVEMLGCCLDEGMQAKLIAEYDMAHPDQEPEKDLVLVNPSTWYGLGALRSAVNRMSSTLTGGRNHMLYQEACFLFELSNSGALDASIIESDLLAAATGQGLTIDEAKATLASAKRKTAGKTRMVPARAAVEVTW